MKKRFLPRIFLGLCLLSIFISGCGEGPSPGGASQKKQTSTVFAMDTVMDLTIYGNENILKEAQDKILELEKQFSVTQEGSEIYRLNHGETVQLSAAALDLLTQALALCRRTNGALDISVYPLVRAWGFTTGEYQIPPDNEISSLLEHIDFQALQLEPGQKTLLLPEGMEIDLGSVAKGYTGNVLISLLKERGVTSALFNLGGNVHALGTKPDGSKWRIAIKNPFGEGTAGILKIEDQAVVTSGGYERFFEKDGHVYWHILDPATGRPAKNGLVSVTVTAKNGLLCDGLSTALFVMGEEKAIDFWKSSSDFEMILISEDKRMMVTEGLADSFSLSEDSPISQKDYQVIAHD
ncbi:MAG: FAD:protein FMN transferase [Eubacteriales bacterium]|nr:FAD:protein FMN transferase [Eubacteriales bacterium]